MNVSNQPTPQCSEASTAVSINEREYNAAPESVNCF